MDLPDGQYRLEHGLVVTKDTSQAPPQETAIALVAVNGLEQRLKDEKLRKQDRQRIEAELQAFRAQVGNGVTIKPVTYRNPQSQQEEASADVFLGVCPRKAISNQESITYRRFQVSNLLILRRAN